MDMNVKVQYFCLHPIVFEYFMSQDLVAKALDALRHKDFKTALLAIDSYKKAHKFELQHYLIKGLSEISLSLWKNAQDTFSEATHHFPYQAQLWLNLGLAQENNEKLDEAITSLEHCLDLDPHQADACGNLSNIYRRKGYFHEAEAMAHRAYEGGAPKAQSLNSLGLALAKQGKYAEANKVFESACTLEPHNALILSNIANLKVDELNFVEAWKYFAAARAVNDLAIIRRDEGMARLLASDYSLGWSLYESRLELRNALRSHPSCPRYTGEQLTGKKLLLLAEQGLGDTIMFCRYGKYFSAQGADVVWVVQQSLKNLLMGQVLGEIYTEADRLPDVDYYLPLLSSPLATMHLEPLRDIDFAYLKAPTKLHLTLQPTAHTKVGLVWSGSRTHERDHERSLGLDTLEPIWKNPNFSCYSLSKGVEASEILPHMPIRNLAAEIHDFSDTAAFIEQMDIIISVDTSVAHLAGAMGIRTFIILPYCPDWRWGLNSEKTPWYPSVTLLRQAKYGDWNSVISALLSKLELEPSTILE